MRGLFKFILLALALLAGGLASAQTAVFNTANSLLTLPSVQVGSTIYTNVVLRLDTVNVVSVGSQAVVTITPGAQATYAGRYRGTFGGFEAGTFDVTIDTAGGLSGSGFSNTLAQNFAVSGQVGSTGGANFASGGAGAATFNGSIATSGVFSGAWTIPGAGSGTFTGQRQ